MDEPTQTLSLPEADIKHFNKVSQATNDALWQWDMRTNLLWWADNFYVTFQYTKEEVETTLLSWTSRIHPDDVEQTLSSMHRCIDLRETCWAAKYRFRRKDGVYRFVYDRGYIERDAQGTAVRMLGAIVDISECVQSAEEMRALNKELERRVRERTVEIEAANAALEAFSYSVSHDLRAPLRHITGFVQLLARSNQDRLDASGTRYLSIILSAAEKMSHLIDALLSFSRLGRSPLQLEAVELNTLVAEVIEFLEPELVNRKVNWQLANLPSVQADLTLLRQVLVNLFDNALKYTRPRSCAEIEVGFNAEPGEFVFFIKDNGVGFDMKYADKLFGVFQRLHSEQAFEGNGVGLANVKRIINRHGGRVWAKSEEGRGATFYFTLPRHEKNGASPSGVSLSGSPEKDGERRLAVS